MKLPHAKNINSVCPRVDAEGNSQRRDKQNAAVGLARFARSKRVGCQEMIDLAGRRRDSSTHARVGVQPHCRQLIAGAFLPFEAESHRSFNRASTCAVL